MATNKKSARSSGKSSAKTAKTAAISSSDPAANPMVYARKDKVFAWASLVCGLLFWVPLFNLLSGPLAIIYGVLAIRRVRQDPERYGGQVIAIIGVTLGVLSVISTIIYLILVGPSLINPLLNSSVNGSSLGP